MTARRRFLVEMMRKGVLLLFGWSNLNLGEKSIELSPFRHGVASGDQLNNSVLLWTRLSVETNEKVDIYWKLCKDANLTTIVASGDVSTSAESDYTIKIDINGLEPGTIYYYQFSYKNYLSVTGRTKTSGLNSTMQLAVISCSDYSAGFYNALANIADRKDLDAVIHLGDYIYEGTTRSFDAENKIPDDEFESTHFNRNREWWLHYYRRRYSITRLDPDMQAAHVAHPFYAIWDDHEIANNAWKDGAMGHDAERDGEWEVRLSAARQAYAEWMPIRGDASKIYRSVKFGNLAELILLDTRIEGRDKQVTYSSHPDLFQNDRSILGATQKKWLFDRMQNSTCQWKIMASQVIFSEVNVQWAGYGGMFTNQMKTLETALLDYWEGYPVERDQVIDFISSQKIKDLVILSASMHCALAFDVTKRATKYSRKNEKSTYDPATSKGAVAVEFATPSLTSANFDDNMNAFYAATFQSMINKKLPAPLGYNPNPHLKFADLQKHGYLILNVDKNKVEARYYFVNELTKRDKIQTNGPSFFTKSGEARLLKSATS